MLNVVRVIVWSVAIGVIYLALTHPVETFQGLVILVCVGYVASAEKLIAKAKEVMPWR